MSFVSKPGTPRMLGTKVVVAKIQTIKRPPPAPAPALEQAKPAPTKTKR